MESVFNTGSGAGGCMVYPNLYPLEAGNPYRELQMEMEHIPYTGPYDYGWDSPWWGIYPPHYSCPYWNGHIYTWTDSTGGTGNA